MAKAKKSLGKKPGKAQDQPAATPAAIDTATVLDETLEIQDVEACFGELRAALASGLPVTLDVSRVARIDTAGVQLLIAAQIAAEKRGNPLQVRGESAALNAAMESLGLGKSFPVARRHD